MSKNAILSRIRSYQKQPTLLPLLEDLESPEPDTINRFLKKTEEAGGTGIIIELFAELVYKIDELFPGRNTYYSNIPGVEFSNRQTPKIKKPHDFSSIELAILKGDLGIAENGSVWVTDKNVPFRSAYFLVHHLVLVVESGNIFQNFQAAYDVSKFSTPGFGCFIAGPSKTADIEQTLVIGAHGAKSVTVFVYLGNLNGGCIKYKTMY